MSLPELRSLLGDAAPLADALLADVRADRSRLPVVFPGVVDGAPAGRARTRAARRRRGR